MKSFIKGLLDKNSKGIENLKCIIITDLNKNDNWFFNYCNIFIMILNLSLITIAFIVAIVMFPISVVMIIINFPYFIYKEVKKHPIFSRKIIKKALFKYETDLNKKFSFVLVTAGGDLVISSNNLKSFLQRFFEEYNHRHATFNSKTRERICGSGRRRSIGDLYLISKYYFPKITLDILITTLIELMNEEKITVSKCSDIKKYVFKDKRSYDENYMTKDLEFASGINFKQLMRYYE